MLFSVEAYYHKLAVCLKNTFLAVAAVYLLIGQNVNKNLTEIDGNFQMDLFGTKPPEIISLG